LPQYLLPEIAVRLLRNICYAKDEPEDLKQIDEVRKLTPEYPGWMFNTQRSDRKPGQVRDWSRFMAAAKLP